MKKRKELTQGKAIVLIIVMYSIITLALGTMYSILAGVLTKYINSMVILSSISVICSIIIIYTAWNLSIMFVLKNRETIGIDTKKTILCFSIFLVIISTISVIFDIYTVKNEIEVQYKIIAIDDADLEEEHDDYEMQEIRDERNKKMLETKKKTYSSVIIMDILGLIINLLMVNIITQKMVEKYDGVIEIEKKTKN